MAKERMDRSIELAGEWKERGGKKMEEADEKVFNKRGLEALKEDWGSCGIDSFPFQ